MLNLLIYIIFIMTVAMASLGVVISAKIRSLPGKELFGSLFYQQVFAYAFGFYGIWGQAAAGKFLTDNVTPELLARIKDLAVIMGFPFLIFSWLMLLRFSAEASGIKLPKRFNIVFLVSNFILLLGTGYYLTSGTDVSPRQMLSLFFMVLSIAYHVCSGMFFTLTRRKSPVLARKHLRLLGIMLPAIVLTQNTALFFQASWSWVGLLFVFLFFVGQSVIPAFLYINGFLVTEEKEKDDAGNSFDTFCNRHEISPRESEIITEICNGLSNKEIADKLFISLQTVKDHTHRIYIKTNVRSRVQLINLVKGPGSL
ncbi:MAG: LuxR C-terminal-related transcriptional regulator [Bacteroidales bacterium]